MPQLIGALVLLVAYGALCGLLIAYVLAPLWPFAVVLGAVVGLALVVTALCGVFLRVGRYASDTVTWSDVPERLPGTKSSFPRDAAWPNYLFAQSRTDLGKAA